jgi:hypothetical protein
MHPSAFDRRELLGNALIGYQLAWRHGRQLLPVLVPALVPMLAVSFALDVMAAGGETAIVNGAFIFGGTASAQSFIKLGLATLSWLLAVTAASIITVGCLRAAPVNPFKALSVALRELPVLALGLCVLGGASFAVLWVSWSAASGLGGPLGFGLAVAALFGVAVVAARMLFTIPARVFGGSAWELTRDRILASAGAFLLGGVVLPLLFASVLTQLRATAVWPIVVDLFDALLLVGVVAVQAGILGYVYLQAGGAAGAGAHEPTDLVDLDVVDRRLAGLAGWPWRRAAWMGVAVPIVALLPTTVAAANPTNAPVMRSHGGGPPGGAMAVAWPPGQLPIIVSNVGVRFCDDDLCEHYTVRNGGPPVMDGYGTAGIGVDGTVIKATLAGGQDNGGPFIHYGRCTRRDGRHEAWLPVRASAEEPFVWSELAVSSAPDGAIWFALAVPPPHEHVGPATLEFKLIRCPDVRCAKPERFSLGSTPGSLDPNAGVRNQGRLSIGPDGRPTAAFWIKHAVFHATCDPVKCAHPRVTVTSGGPPDAAWTPLDAAGSDVAWVTRGGLQIGERNIRLAETNFDQRSAAVAGGRAGIHAVTAVRAAQPPGLRVTFGPQPQYWRQVLWYCPDPDCHGLRRVPLDVFEGRPRPVKLAVADDGRVLIVREDRITLLPPPA